MARPSAAESHRSPSAFSFCLSKPGTGQMDTVNHWKPLPPACRVSCGWSPGSWPQVETSSDCAAVLATWQPKLSKQSSGCWLSLVVKWKLPSQPEGRVKPPAWDGGLLCTTEPVVQPSGSIADSPSEAWATGSVLWHKLPPQLGGFTWPPGWDGGFICAMRPIERPAQASAPAGRLSQAIVLLRMSCLAATQLP